MSLEQAEQDLTAAEAVMAPQMPEDMPADPTDHLYGPEQQEPDAPAISEETLRHIGTIYGSFWIDQSEFAIPVDAIQEVVNEPEEYASVPLAPDHMAGLFHLRGMIIPVIDLRQLLGFPAMEPASQRKIAIIEQGDLNLGLLFDDTGGVVNGDGASIVDFEANEAGIKDVVIAGMLKMNQGERMLQILNPYELLKIERVPRVSKKNADTETNSALGQRLNCISFQVGHTHCAIDLRHVQEIMDVPEIQQSPLAFDHILGNINLRGHTIPVIDFRAIMGDAPMGGKVNPEHLKKRKLLILALDEGQIALLVYSIDSILPFFESELLPFAKVALLRHDIILGCLVKPPKEIVILLDHVALKRDPKLTAAAQACREIFPPELKKKDTKAEKDTTSTRRTYIVFSVEKRFALNIEYVSEVINRPAELLQPPFALEFVDGILNLRGELITLINPRHLYELPASEQSGKKVLIFQKDGQKHGMVVDTVDEIVASTDAQILDVPALGKQGVSRIVSQDVTGCLNAATGSSETDPVMILNVDSLISRCADSKPGGEGVEA